MKKAASMHRGDSKGRLDYKAAAWAGVIAGAAFMILEMLLTPLLLQGSPWDMPRRIAAIALGPEALTVPSTFGLGIFLLAMAIHFSLSIVYAIILAMLVDRMPPSAATLVGVIFGFALFAVNFYLFTYLFPWFASERNAATAFVHVVFGAFAGYCYTSFGAPRPVGFERRAPLI
jgi:hypothetical protein